MNKNCRYLFKLILFICLGFVLQINAVIADAYIMPNLIGKDKDEARQILRGYSWHSTMYNPYKNTEAPNNHIFRTKPAPGESVTRNDDIVLDFSENFLTPEKFNSLNPIPNVIGMTKDAAIKALNNAGWESFTPAGFSTHKIGIDYVGVDPTNSFKNGEVLKAVHSQDGWGVNLTILKKDTVPMPNLIGKSYREAEQTLKNMGLFKEIKREEIIYSEEFLKQNPSRAGELHTVVRVTPKAGTMINPDTDNYVWVAEGVPAAEKSVAVPNIGQLKEADAVARLKNAGLIPQITYEKTFDAFLGGTASVKTDPGQGSTVKAGDTVKITIYLYKPKVPFLKGYTIQEAKDKLTALGLKYEIAYKSTPTQSLDGQISDYSPAAQTQVEPGSVVKIVVYKNDQIKIPNLVGMQEQKAIAYLKEYKSNLKYNIIYQNTVYTVLAGQVLKLSPEYNTIVKPGDTLTLYVYKMLDSVPDVKGKTESEAVSVLGKAGFEIRKAYIESKEVGKVIEQSQKAGEAVKGVVITIIVGKKPDDIKLPDLRGKSQQEAINTILAGKTLTYKILYRYVYNSSKDGIVTSTVPAPNTMSPPDAEIILFIGKYVGRIPNVVGLSEHDARNKLGQAGFAGIVLYTGQGTPGKVLNQKPDAGSEPAGVKGNLVNIYVTRTQTDTNNQYNPDMREYVIPYLEGFSLVEAQNMLAANKINFVIDEIPTGRDRNGKVLGTYPPRGVEVNPNQIVNLKVGKAYYAVPNLIGMTAFKATSIIHQNRMQVTYTGDPAVFRAPAKKRTFFKRVPLISHPQSSAPPSSSSSMLNNTSGNAIVINQNPKPGVPKQGSYIEITLAYDVKVPDIMHKHFSEAINQLRENALKYDIEYVPVKEGSKSGMVLNMAPHPGQQVAVFTPVRIQIGKITDSVPDVLGKSENEAEAILKNLNFYPEKEYISASKSNNVVIAQGQNPGAKRGPSNIKLILGTPESLSSISVPTPVIQVAPKVMASLSMKAKGAPPVAQAGPPPSLPANISAPSPVFTEDLNKIREFYNQFKAAYESKDEYQVVSLVSGDWNSNDGSSLSDLEDNLHNMFAVFDEIQYNLNEFSVQKGGQAQIYRVSYTITIMGTIYESNITRTEKSSVQELVKIENGTVRIVKTLNGNFWYID